MSGIEKWFAHAEEREIEGLKVMIHPLNIKHLQHFVDMENPNKMSAAIERILRVSLEKSFPGITEEAIEQIPATTLIKYLMVIMEVNGLDVADSSEELIRQYQEKQKQ